MRTIKFDYDYGARVPFGEQDDWQQRAHGYTITLGYHGRTAKFDYWMGEALTDDPDLDSVMSCLTLDARSGEMSFEEFCGDFGYDEDSRKAYATWEACKRHAADLRRLFGYDYEEIMDKEWDA